MIRENAAMLQIALQKLSCNQTELAKRLGVSKTQITKWKQGESMSSEKEEQIRKMTGIGDRDARFVLAVGSVETVDKWAKLMTFLAERANEDAQDNMGFETHPFADELETLPDLTFDTMNRMGVEWPKTFPAELDFDYETRYEREDADVVLFWEQIFTNAHALLIGAIYKSYTNVYAFYSKYISGLFDDDHGQLDGDEIIFDIQGELLSLAASKLGYEEGARLVTKDQFEVFKRGVTKDYVGWLTVLKERAYEARIPLPVEVMDLVSQSTEELGDNTEVASLGIWPMQIHPDIYMNELLQGMRTIHQVLPAIMKKLGITQEEFQLDRSELSLPVSELGIIESRGVRDSNNERE